MKPFQFAAEVESLSTRLTGSVKIVLGTQENLAHESLANLFELRGKQVWVAILAEQEIKLEDLEIPEIEPEFENDRTPSQRLRAILYRLWEKEGKSETFARYYQDKMEKLCEHFKEKLP